MITVNVTCIYCKVLHINATVGVLHALWKPVSSLKVRQWPDVFVWFRDKVTAINSSQFLVLVMITTHHEGCYISRYHLEREGSDRWGVVLLWPDRWSHFVRRRHFPFLLSSFLRNDDECGLFKRWFTFSLWSSPREGRLANLSAAAVMRVSLIALGLTPVFIIHSQLQIVFLRWRTN